MDNTREILTFLSLVAFLIWAGVGLAIGSRVVAWIYNRIVETVWGRIIMWVVLGTAAFAFLVIIPIIAVQRGYWSRY